MWTNEGTLIRPGLALALPVSSAGGWAGGLRVFRDNAMFLGVTGSPVPCGAVGEGSPGLTAPSRLGLLGDLSRRASGSIPTPTGRGHLWALLITPVPGLALGSQGQQQPSRSWLCLTGSCPCPCPMPVGAWGEGQWARPGLAQQVSV